MTRIYSIHLAPMALSILVLAHNKNISTHYAYDTYQPQTITPKTQSGFAPKPTIQRKAAKDEQPLKQTEKPVSAPVAEEPKPRNTVRNDVNKEALAQYFDNDVLPTPAEMAMEKMDAWLIQVMTELEAAAQARADAAKKEYEEIRKFVESVRTPAKDTAPEKDSAAETPEKPKTPVAKTSDAQRKEINDFIADRCTKKHAKTDASAKHRVMHKNKQLSKKTLMKMLATMFQKTK